MKKTSLLFFLFSVALLNNVAAQKALIKQIEEKENRFFYKPVANRYIRNSEIDFDNSAYMDIKPEGNNVITLDVYALNEDAGGWVKSTSVHGEGLTANHKYIKLINEVYIVENALGESEINLNVRDKPSFILYNREKGVYYHSYSSDNNSGWGAYTTTKEKMKDKTSAYELLKKYDNLFESEVYAYNSDVPKRLATKINEKKDDGFISDFHKANAGKLLFGNAVSPANVSNAATYKNKFAIDEPIMVTIFGEKGFNKYVDITSSDPADIENFTKNGESVFDLQLNLSNGTKVSRLVYIKHPDNRFLTLYIHDMLFGKAKSTTSENNNWIKKDTKLDGLKEEVQVNVQLFTRGGSPYKVAEGNFSFIPKAGAVMPYGYSCSPGNDTKIDNLAKIKPVILANFKKALAKKPETSMYQVTEFAIVSNWQESSNVPFPYIEINFVVKNQKGECLSGADKYAWIEPKMPAEQSGYFIRAESKLGGLVENLYPYCDCRK